MEDEFQPLSRSEWCRALDYPYLSPSGSFALLLPDGEWEPVDESLVPAAEPPGCRAVLAIGSNGAPEQLGRKLRSSGSGSLVNVRVDLHGYDVVYAARIAGYGAIPATFVDSPETTVSVVINLLNQRQFDLMNESEGLGTAYELVDVDPSDVTHPVFAPHRVNGYRALCGPLLDAGQPVALAAIEASGRTFPASTERDLLGRMAAQHGLQLEEFVRRCVRDPEHRRLVNLVLPTAGIS